MSHFPEVSAYFSLLPLPLGLGLRALRWDKRGRVSITRENSYLRCYRGFTLQAAMLDHSGIAGHLEKTVLYSSACVVLSRGTAVIDLAPNRMRMHRDREHMTAASRQA